MSMPSSLRWPGPSAGVSYAVAVLAVAAAVVAARLLVNFPDTSPIVSLFLCTTMFIAWFGGTGPALLGTVLSVLAFDYYFVSPTNSFAVAAKDIPRLVLFTVASLFVVVLSATQRNTAESLRRARDSLQAAVQKLEQVTTALQAESAERRRAEQEIRRAERNLQATIDTIPALVASYWPDGDRDFINRTGLNYSGHSLAEVRGSGTWIAAHPDDIESADREWRSCLASGTPFQMELRYRRADGAYRWHMVRRVPLRDDEGELVKWYGVAFDIEDQRRAEGALQRSEAYLEEAQRLSRTGSFGWKVVGGDITWSKETFEIMQVDRAVKPTIDLALQRVHPDDRHLVQLEMGLALQGKQKHDYEHRLLLPDGSVKYLHVRAHRVVYDSGEEEIVGALVDVTAAKRAHEALQETQAELAHVTRVATLGELTASIAHEVNQPLTGIVTNGDACLRWLDREVPAIDEARRAVKRIISDADRATNVIRRLRDLSKKATPEMAPLDIDDVIDEAVLLVQRQALSQRVRLNLDLASGLPLVLGDRIQLQQVIINLMVNGIEAMASVTERTRELVVQSRLYEGDEVLVAVRDVGVGIEPENANRLFAAFYTTKPNGMGMGLSICRSIVEAHGGRIWASANAGPGATIQFSLPQHPKAEE
jgi:PAS domain S-box-containing protein